MAWQMTLDAVGGPVMLMVMIVSVAAAFYFIGRSVQRADHLTSDKRVAELEQTVAAQQERIAQLLNRCASQDERIAFVRGGTLQMRKAMAIVDKGAQV